MGNAGNAWSYPVGSRSKKLIGTMLLVFMVPLYGLFVAVIASARMAEASTFAQVTFFAFFGLVWIFPAGAIIRWMAYTKPRSARR